MAIPLALTELRVPEHPGGVLVVGPSLGTAVTPLWESCVEHLPIDLAVVGWDLPGHGNSQPHDEPFTVEDLAQSVIEATDEVREDATGMVLYAGVALGAAVGIALAIEHAHGLDGVVSIASAANGRKPDQWRERAELVRRSGTSAVVDASAEEWFAPGTIDREPGVTAALLDSLRAADPGSYARCCEALALFDPRELLGRIEIPVLALAGEHDAVAPVTLVEAVAEGARGSTHTISGAGHLPPAEQPGATAHEITAFLTGPVAAASSW